MEDLWILDSKMRSLRWLITGNKLLINNDISYKDFPSGIVLGLGALDKGGLIFTQNYAIHVQDVNEPPGEISWEIQQTCTHGKC